MFDLDKYLADLILNCRSAFGERLLYVGLQGSWLRGEAHKNSDIDIMVILDGFSVRDMDTYCAILKEISFYERSCGFICGKALESSEGMPAASYDERPGRRTDGLSSARDSGRRNQLCQFEPG